MEEFEVQLRSSISTVLSSLSSEEVNGVIQSLYDVGVVSLSDLEFVREEDLSALITPIQRRKLIKYWTTLASSFVQPEFRLPEEKKSWKQNKQQNNPPKKEKWRKFAHPKLLEIFFHYKMEFDRPEKLHIWQDIATEVKKECLLNIDFVQCYIMIVRQMRSFLHYKKNGVTSITAAKLYHEMKNAFAIPGDSDSLCMLDSLIGQLFLLNAIQFLDEKGDRRLFERKEWTKKRRIQLLRIFSRHKMQLYSDINAESLWKDIADEMNRSCFLNFDSMTYRIEVLELIVLYLPRTIKGLYSTEQAVTYMQKAFNMVLGDTNGSAVADDLISPACPGS